MARNDTQSTKITRGIARPPKQEDFWERFGWETTKALCFGIGAFGLLQFLLGVAALPTHPLIDTFELLVLFPATPLLIFAGITAFCIALHNVVRHFVFDG